MVLEVGATGTPSTRWFNKQHKGVSKGTYEGICFLGRGMTTFLSGRNTGQVSFVLTIPRNLRRKGTPGNSNRSGDVLWYGYHETGPAFAAPLEKEGET
jgi:hypothetical protein